jgi:hypothetical protein
MRQNKMLKSALYKTVFGVAATRTPLEICGCFMEQPLLRRGVAATFRPSFLQSNTDFEPPPAATGACTAGDTKAPRFWIAACSVRPVAEFGRAAGSTLQRLFGAFPVGGVGVLN